MTKPKTTEAHSMVKVIFEPEGVKTKVTVRFPNGKQIGVKSSGTPYQIATALGLLASEVD